MVSSWSGVLLCRAAHPKRLVQRVDEDDASLLLLAPPERLDDAPAEGFGDVKVLALRLQVRIDEELPVARLEVRQGGVEATDAPAQAN